MVIDTNILIAYLAGETAVATLLHEWRLKGGFLYIPAVVEAEVLSFPKLSTTECARIVRFIEENFISIPLDQAVARIAADLRRLRNVKLADAAIAASALYKEAPLITRNIKDFKKIPGLKLISA